MKIFPFWILLAVCPPLYAGLIAESGPGRAAGLSWETLRLSYQLSAETEPGWRLEARGLLLDEPQIRLGNIELSCPSAFEDITWPECAEGAVRWSPQDGEVLTGDFHSHRDAAGNPVLEISLSDPRVQARLVLAEDDMQLRLSVDDLPLGRLAGPLTGLLSLSELDGRVSATAEYHTKGGGTLQATGRAHALAFDTPDGTLAAADVSVAFKVALTGAQAGRRFDVTLTQSAGEWLFGPVYVPAPEQPVRLDMEGVQSDERLTVERLRLQDPDILNTSGHLVLDLGDEIVLRTLELQTLEMKLPAAQQRYLNGVLTEFALDDITTAGAITGQLRFVDDGLERLDLVFADVLVEDARERFGIAGLNGRAQWTEADDELDVALNWDGANLHHIPLGAADLQLVSEAGHLSLARPLIVPVFDGAVHVDRLAWRDWRTESAHLVLDARLEPVDFSPLSLALGWPELGGRVSGQIPAVSYSDDGLAFSGGIAIEAFSGRIDISDLAIERPFGTLPGLTAQVEFEALDLLEVTGAFGFGRMEGRLEGHIHDLRMLDWQPVAFDARLASVKAQGVRRRISQRAVDNLSSLGGGGAALTTPLLRFFEDFSYKKFGLACRLSNNVCHIDGVGEADDGGFVIVQGSGIPRLNIIGHRRLVDWPTLVQQLQTIPEGGVEIQ